MSLKSSFVAKVITDLGKGEYEIGTAYPIREGVVITAYHVIPDIENLDKTYLEWVRDDQAEEGESTTSHYLTEILYISEKYDVLIAKCQTPDKLPDVVACPVMPQSDEKWESLGYPESGVDNEKSIRLKDPAGGTYFFQKEDHWEQHLESKADPDKTSLWQGMSGAPVFTVGTNKLTAIITKVPDDDNPQHKDRIYVTSLAYLLNHSDEKLQTAIYGTNYVRYNEEGKEKLQAHLKKLKKAHPRLCEQLPELDDLLSSLNKDTITCIRDLKKQCSGQHSTEVQKQIETLFYLLLSQLDVPCNWEGKHLHELQVSTRLLAELTISRLYNVSPKFSDSDSDSLIGKHVLPASQKELGFDIEDEAVEQANTVAYALYKRWGNEGLTKEALMEAPNRLQGVNEDIVLLREDDEKIYRFEINTRSEEALDGEHPLLIQEVRNHLQKLLPDLPIVIYGGSADSVVADEERIQTNVRSFIKKIIRSE